MPVTKAPRLYLTPTPLSFGKQVRVLLQDPETASPVMAFKMIPRAIPGTQGPWESGKGSFEL